MSSLSFFFDKYYYYSRVFLRDAREQEQNQITVSLHLIEKSILYLDDISDIRTEISMSKEAVRFPFSNDYHYLRRYTSAPLATYLSILCVPREEQPIILDKIFEVLQVCRPDQRIVVLIAEVDVSSLAYFQDLDNLDRRMRADPEICVSIRFGADDGDPSEWDFERIRLCGLDYHGVNEAVLQDSFEALTLRFLPATTSSINSLQKVSLDALEESTIKHYPSCTICMDYFAEAGADKLITPLPCAHIYHSDCIVEWLKTSHQCPVCRYPMPTAEEGEPSNP